LAILCILANMSLFALAAETDRLIISGETVNEISITSNVSDVLTITDGACLITATDYVDFDDNWNEVYMGDTVSVTFTNDYAGYIKLTYTLSADGTYPESVALNAGTDCTVENGVITMQAGGTFTISVTSSTNTDAASPETTTATFSLSAIEKEKLAPELKFEQPDADLGSFTVTDAAGDSVGSSGQASKYNFKATPKSGYQFFRWVLTDNSGNVTYFGKNSASYTYEPTVEGTVTCEFMRTGSAIYSVNSVEYAYLDQAVAVAGSGKNVILTAGGTVYHSEGDNEITIPSTVTMVLPYASGQTLVAGSGDAHPYANSTDGTSYSDQPGSPTDSYKYLELIIPDGTTVINNGVIAVGGTLQGNAAPSGAHSNLKVDGKLELKSSTSVLSACGFVYGNGDIVADGSGAKIYQPLALLRANDWGLAVGSTGTTFSGVAGALSPGMVTTPADGYDGINPSPRYATQNIQCNLQMKYNDIMYGYCNQYCNSTHYRCTVVLVGKDSGNGLIILNNNATLTSKYDKDKKSSFGSYNNVGKLTLTISGGAAQGNISLSAYGYEMSLNKWPLPVPYNYDLILTYGTYNLTFDLHLLPGAGLKVGEGATLNVPSGCHLAVFTGTNDHTSSPTHKDPKTFMGIPYSRQYATKTVSYHGATTQSSPYYPLNSSLGSVSTLNGISSGSMMANFIVADTGILNVESNAYFGGVVQTTGGGKVIMNGVTTNKSDKDYVFTGQLGLTGKSNDMDMDTWAQAGATIYKFYPQFFDAATGKLTRMESGMTYYGVNVDTNSIPTYTFDLYTSSADVTAKTTHTETINATAVGEWSTIPTVQALNVVEGSVKEIKGYGTLKAAMADYPNITADKPYLQINLASPVVVKENERYVLSDQSDAEMKSNVYLDLNGVNITGNITSYNSGNYTLYGFDSGTDGYTVGGSITGTVSKYASINSLDRSPNAGKYYVAVADEGVVTFPRVAVHVTGLQFALDTAKNTGYLTFRGTFRGNTDAAKKLNDVGFMFDNTNSVWFSKPDTENGESYSGSISSPVDKMHFYYTKPLETINDITDAAALMKLADSDTPYPGKSVEVDTLLKQIKDAIAGSEYEQHQGLNDYFENLNNVS